MTKPLIVGLIGGIASGKSTVARWLQDRGALWLDSDRMAHEVLDRPNIRALLSERFGSGVLDPFGRIDRKRIAVHVFGHDPVATENLEWLESLVHPLVRQLTEQRIQTEGENHSLVIIDAPLLIEAGWAPRCDRILLIDTPRHLRERLATTRGWSIEELDRREAAQMSIDEKRQYATDSIVNDGDLQQLQHRIESWWNGLHSDVDADIRHDGKAKGEAPLS